MNHIKQFFREKGLYLFCLAMVFAATAAGILALRTVVSNVADLTRTRKEALQNDSAWTQPDTAIDKPAQDVPKPTTTPAATEKPSATPAPAAAQATGPAPPKRSLGFPLTPEPRSMQPGAAECLQAPSRLIGVAVRWQPG